jgi:glycogen debranching enzyme
VLALSLPYPILDRRRWRPVMTLVREHLYTPFGLRTLAPSEPGYRGICAGSPQERDSAYHQGTVWPWLLGPYYEAHLKLHGFSKQSRRAVAQALAVWSGHLREAGLGTVSEIFDGDIPHRPRGCIAQAWSVAELLRVCQLVRNGPETGEAPERVAAAEPPSTVLPTAGQE